MICQPCSDADVTVLWDGVGECWCCGQPTGTPSPPADIDYDYSEWLGWPFG